jgi:cytochrome P450
MDLSRLARQVGRDDPAGDPDPFATLRWLRAGAPVTEVPGPRGSPVWLVTSHELARQCLTDPRLSFDPRNARVPQHAPHHVPYVLAQDPPGHTHLRRLVGSVFSPGSLERMRPTVTRICRDAVARLAGRSTVDLMTDFAIPIPEAVTYALFGIPRDEELPPGRATELSIVTALSEQHAGGPASDELHRYIDHVVASGCYEGTDNLTSTLVGALARGETDRATVAGLLYLLFSTGQLSTAPFIAACLIQLMQHPVAADAVRLDPSRCRAVLNEALRHSSVVQTSMPRFALQSMELGGQTIAAGDTVLISIAGANHDPDRFIDPDQFRPDRPSQHHLAFGFGIHFCVGAPLARLEAEIALSELFRRYTPELMVAPEELVWVLGPMLRCPRDVPVRLIERAA